MRKVMIWMLRLPFLGLIYIVVMGAIEKLPHMSKSDIAMHIGGISLCIGVCIAAGLLHRPIPSEKQSKIYRNMQLFFGLAIAGVVFGKQL